MQSLTRTWAPLPGVGPGLMLVHRRGAGDPSYRLDGDTHWRGLRTPEGPATLRVGPRDAEAWGPGRAWVLEQLPRMMGADDDASDFERLCGAHPLLEQRLRRGIPRIGASGLVMDALLPAILEQKVTGQEAFGGFRRLLRRYGDPAPGPREDLWIQPSPETLRTIPSWEWLRLSVDQARSRAIVTAARVAASLERIPMEVAEQRLTSLPGIGEWTAAEVRQRAYGDPDAVSFGDYHVAKDVGWAVTEGADRHWDDERLRAFLEPFRPHRGRVVVLLAGLHRPRHGPRLAPRTHLPT